MSTQQKGWKHEHEVVKLLEQENYEVYRPQKVRFYGSQDIFGLFDIIAINAERLIFIQVKTGSTKGFLKKLNAWREAHPVTVVEWQLWVRMDARKHKQKWRVF